MSHQQYYQNKLEQFNKQERRNKVKNASLLVAAILATTITAEVIGMGLSRTIDYIKELNKDYIQRVEKKEKAFEILVENSKKW